MNTLPFTARNKTSRCLLVILALSLLLSACSILPQAQPTTPITTFFSTNTATAKPTATTTATMTPTVTPTVTATATITPTETPNATATAGAVATADAQVAMATVQPYLDKYQISADSGHLLWSDNDPVTLEVTKYNDSDYYPLNFGETSDFLFQTTIEWDSTSGLAGCAIDFRSEQDFKNGEQYRYAMMRLQNVPMWQIQYRNFGEIQNTINTESSQFLGHIKDQRNSKNRIALLVQGNELTVFINGEKLPSAQNNKITKGYMAFMVWQESGKTSCIFSNSWLWALNQK